MNPRKIKSEVDRIISEYEQSPEVGHDEEDRLLAEYIRDRAAGGDNVARHLVRLLDTERDRWFA